MSDVALENGLGDSHRRLKPPLKWAGGKRWIVPQLMPLWGATRSTRLVEPFCGALSISLGLSPINALLNDANPHAINFYRQLQAGLQVRIPMANDRELYTAHRLEFNACIERGRFRTKKAATLFYYLNRTGYNGLCRFNKRGHFNVPFGRYEKINYTYDFRPYRDVLANWEFSDRDFESVAVEDTDFIYADPPYDVEFRQYIGQGFDWEDQVRLANWLAAHRGPVVASNQATARICALYKDLGFKVSTVKAPRMINSSGDRTPALEIIATRGIP
jgi:DNA adenine methylase